MLPYLSSLNHQQCRCKNQNHLKKQIFEHLYLSRHGDLSMSIKPNPNSIWIKQKNLFGGMGIESNVVGGWKEARLKSIKVLKRFESAQHQISGPIFKNSNELEDIPDDGNKNSKKGGFVVKHWKNTGPPA